MYLKTTKIVFLSSILALKKTRLKNYFWFKKTQKIQNVF